MNFKIPAFVATSGACCTAALLLIVFGWSAVHAQPVDPNIILPCPAQQPQNPITYGAKPGETVGPALCPTRCPEISVTFNSIPGGNVFWGLTQQPGCKSGTGGVFQCAPDTATPPEYLFNVKAPTGSVSPATSLGRVQITSVRAIAPGDVGVREGAFSTTVTHAATGATCTWDYLLHVVNAVDPGGWGDPHITTVDGVHYDFQSAGEFTALKEDEFEVQTRQSPVPTTMVPGPTDYTGLGVCVSIYSAVAARIGSNHVSLQPNLSGEPDPSGLQLRVNGGEPVTLTDSGFDLRAGGSTESSAQLEGRITKAAGGAYEFTAADGTQLVATPAYWDSQQTWYLNLRVYQTSATQGIWGRLADDSWLPALPDGTSLGSRPEALDQRYQVLYGKFADAWRVTDATSMFDYAEGTNTATFTDSDWPRFNPESCLIEGQTPAEPTTLQIAAETCNGITDPDQNADCTFDVTVTGNTGFAETYGTMQAFRPHGTGWQPVLAGVDLPTSKWPWWWWILIVIPVLILIAVLIARKLKTA